MISQRNATGAATPERKLPTSASSSAFQPPPRAIQIAAPTHKAVTPIPRGFRLVEGRADRGAGNEPEEVVIGSQPLSCPELGRAENDAGSQPYPSASRLPSPKVLAHAVLESSLASPSTLNRATPAPLGNSPNRKRTTL